MTRLTTRDVRISAVCVDGGGAVFSVRCEAPAYRASIWRRDPNGGYRKIRDLPGVKHSTACVAILGDALYVQYGARPEGSKNSDCELWELVIPGVAVPLSSAAPVTVVAPHVAAQVMVDSTARASVAAVVHAQAVLSSRIDAVTARISAHALSESQVADLVWSKAPDAVYADIQKSDSGIVGVLRARLT